MSKHEFSQVEIYKFKTIHKIFSFRNRHLIEKSENCACFYCLSRFTPQQVHRWTDRKQTALCPECGIDTVIGDLNFQLTDQLLHDLEAYFFKIK